MKNHLKNETSPYLLQHASNPVDWYPWGDEAFERAKAEDKPVFLSIGYSTCHWCHVMAHESFEDEETARILNQSFISIKVDREERPDIDSIYMAVCQAFTGSGGWPTSIFMTPEQKPFFAGTYFPKNSRGRMIGFKDLLTAIGEKWRTERQALTEQAEWIVERLKQPSAETRESDPEIIETAIELYKEVYDPKYGGFGSAPKFPTPHNILFLLAYYERSRDDRCLKMAEHTLEQMYRGGLFDHIGYGFCRYSTDERFLVPHFEKMLYDNALLIMTYSKAYAVTKREFYLKAAQKTAEFVLRELTSPEGGFYTAQDADSGGEEGKYYLFSPDETIRLLGEKEGAAFNRRFDITAEGNFEGKNIPNLLASDIEDESLEALLPRVREYRRERCSLHLDDKILTAQNSLMTAALCLLYRAGKNEEHLAAAKRAEAFIQKNLCSDDTIFVSFRLGKRGVKGFVDDYAAYIFALLNLYTATLERQYLDRAKAFCAHALKLFKDKQNGGFFLYGKENESLILRPKESYDGAVPSGNSLMAWNLVRLYQLTYEQEYENEAKRQLEFLSAEAARYPIGYAMFLLSLLDHRDPPPRVTVVAANEAEAAKAARDIPIGAVAVLQEQSDEYKLKDGKTTFYICKNQSCLPPVNDLNDLFGGL